MRRQFRFAFFSIIVLLAAVCNSHLAHAQDESASQTRRLITQPIDEGSLVTLPGNTRPEANATNDRGPVSDDFPMEHMQIQLQLPAEKEQALEQLNRDLVDPASPNFHKWLTPDQFRQQFSLAPEDIDAITSWLVSQGFTVNVVYPRSIDFSGTAGQVRNAFKTEIHNLEVNGVKHFANMSDQQIPAGLAPALVGVVSMNDFMPHPLLRQRAANYTIGNGYYAVVPADLATIYNFNPVFATGISGQGQTIVVVEDSDVYSTADWSNFRTALGLSSYMSGSFMQVHPAPPSETTNCSDPGVNGDDSEATLDSEWASAGAPNAEIELISCTNTSTFGGFIALQNLLNASATPPGAVSISYGESEASLGATGNAFINALYQQAVTEGVSVFVSAGDSGAASSDSGATYAKHGIAVSGFASTPYNVSAGGTDFSDSYSGTANTYWNSTNTAGTYGSAKSYIPEIPWNDSCASHLFAIYFYGSSETTYGSGGFCNSAFAENNGFINIVAGSGGPSGCATGTPSTSGAVSGTCAGYPKPSWQSVLGNPSDGVRDIPDVSLFAANGYWGHYYVVCFTDPSNGGKSCASAPNTWTGFGGTSFSAPIMASVQALINQTTGSSSGNPNPTYYSLANAEYGSAGSTSCNSTLGNEAGGSCIFYDVTLGDIDVTCGGANNCYLPSGTYGVLAESASPFQPAFGTTTGWDFATGIGTVNVANLVNAWPRLVPNVVGDTQSAASAAIVAAGLTVGTVTQQSSSTVAGGLVISETPVAGTSAAPRSAVNLVVSTGPALLQLRPASIGFGSEGLLSPSAPKTATLINNNPSAIGISAISISGANAADFTQSTTTCGPTLAAKAHCTITLVFTPSVLGIETASLTTMDDATNSPQTVALTGTGVQPVTLSPSSLPFGNQGIASPSAAKTVTFRNNDDQPVTFAGVTTTAADFVATATTCGASIAAHSSCTVSVTYTPLVAGEESATLTITDNASNNSQLVSLSGKGVAQFTLSAASINFGNQAFGTTSAAKSVTLTNNTSAAVTISSISLGGTDPSDFTQPSTTCGASLNGHSSCTVSFTFSPTAASPYAATGMINDGASNSPQSITLSGTGLVPVSATPASLTYATQTVGTTSTAETVTVKNNLPGTLTISSITFTGTNAGDFLQSATTCGTSLVAGASCSVGIQFQPSAAGTRTAFLNVTDSGATSPQSVSLSGTGK